MKTIEGFPDYMITEDGRVWSKRLERFLKANVQHNHVRVGLRKGTNHHIVKDVHHLVAVYYLPNPTNKRHVRHKDGNILNNHVSNLEWYEGILHFFKEKIRVTEEEPKDAKVPDGFPDYKVTRDGRVYSLVLKKFLLLSEDRLGYLHVKLQENGKKKTCSVHRLVAEAYIPKVEGKNEVNHINGRKNENNVENLEFCSRLENMQHAFRTGLRRVGSGKDWVGNRFTKEDILEIRKMFAEGASITSLAVKYNTSITTLSRIRKRQSWKNI